MSDWTTVQWLLFILVASLVGVGAGTVLAVAAVWFEDWWLERRFNRLRRRGEW